MKTKTLYIMTIRAILAVGLTLLASTSCQGQVKTTETSASGADYSKTELTDKQDVIPLPATDGEWLTRNTDGSFIYEPAPTGGGADNSISEADQIITSLRTINVTGAGNALDFSHSGTIQGVLGSTNFDFPNGIPTVQGLATAPKHVVNKEVLDAAIAGGVGTGSKSFNPVRITQDTTITSTAFINSRYFFWTDSPTDLKVTITEAGTSDGEYTTFKQRGVGKLTFEGDVAYGFQTIDSTSVINVMALAGSVEPSGSWENNSFGGVPVIESFTNNWGNSVSPASVNKPTGVQTNDLLLIMVSDDQADTATASFDQTDAPVGFTFETEVGDAVSDTHLGIYYRIADGTEGASFSVSLQGNDFSISCLRISGVDLIDPIGIVGTSQSEGSSTSIAIPGITTVLNNSLIIGVASTDGSDVDYSSLAGSGWVYGGSAEGIDSSDNTNSTWVNKGMPITGATGSPTVSFAAQDGLVGLQFEIKSQ